MESSTTAYTFSRILEISEKSYYRWKKKDHVTLLSLLESHFHNNELQEFLETGKIKKYELIKNMSYEELKDILNQADRDPTQAVYINRVLHTFNMRSLAYLFYLLKEHTIKDSTDLYNFNLKKDQENFFIRFMSDWYHNEKDNVLSFARNRKEFNEYIELYLTKEEVDFVFKNKEIFISSVHKILQQKLD